MQANAAKRATTGALSALFEYRAAAASAQACHVDGLAGTVGVRDDGQSRRAVFDPAPASHMRYAVRDEPCMTRLTTMAAMPASTALAAGDASMSVIGFDPCA